MLSVFLILIAIFAGTMAVYGLVMGLWRQWLYKLGIDWGESDASSSTPRI